MMKEFEFLIIHHVASHPNLSSGRRLCDMNWPQEIISLLKEEILDHLRINAALKPPNFYLTPASVLCSFRNAANFERAEVKKIAIFFYNQGLSFEEVSDLIRLDLINQQIFSYFESALKQAFKQLIRQEKICLNPYISLDHSQFGGKFILSLREAQTQFLMGLSRAQR